jgi:hypothetical protein
MSRRNGERPRLDQVRERLTRWRERHGGPGIPLPEPLWAAAAEVARSEGVGATARALRVDRWRLAARTEAAEPDGGTVPSGGFVEIDASQLCLSPQRVVVRFESGEGDRLEVELGEAATVDVVALAHAFFGRRR